MDTLPGSPTIMPECRPRGEDTAMTTEHVTRTIQAAIKGKMEKTSPRGLYLAIQVLRTGMQFPETYNCWDPKQLEHVQINTTATLILHRDNLKADRQDDGQIGSYWWSIAGVADTAPPEEPIHAPSSQREEPEPQHPVPPTAWRDPKGASIERQVALKAAVDLAGFKIAAGKDIGAREVMQVSSLFDRWLVRNFDLEAPQDASTASAE